MLRGRQTQISLGILLLLTIGACVFAGTYLRSKDFAPVSASAAAGPLIVNPEVLLKWLPADSYAAAAARIRDYAVNNDLGATSITARDNVRSGAGSYDFILTAEPGGQILSLSVSINAAGTTLSTAVTINGELQTDQTSSTRNSTAPNGSSVTTTFDGQDELINRGATVDQVNEFQAAVQRFAPSANNVVINTDTLNSLLGTDGNITYSFELSIDGTAYHAELTCIGVTQSTLTLADPTNEHGVFDSGLMDSNE